MYVDSSSAHDTLLENTTTTINEMIEELNSDDPLFIPPEMPTEKTTAKSPEPIPEETPEEIPPEEIPEDSHPQAHIEGETAVMQTDEEEIIPVPAEPPIKNLDFSIPSILGHEGDEILPFHRTKSSVVIEEVPIWTTVALPPPLPPTDIIPNDTLLGKIESMLTQLREHFDKFLKEVTEKVTALEKKMSRGFAEIQHNTDEFKRLLQIGGKTTNHTITSIGQVMDQSVTLANNQIQLEKKTQEHNFKTCEEVETFKKDVIATLTVEVRKGEDKVKEVLDKKILEMKNQWDAQLKGISTDVQKQIHGVKFHTYDTAVWMNNQILPDFPVNPNEAPPPQLNPTICMPTFSPRPELYEAPPEDSSHIWASDQQEHPQKIPPEVQVPKIRKYGEGASASRSFPIHEAEKRKAQEFAEVWSPTSKSLILETLKLVVDYNEDKNAHYSPQEWELYEKSLTKRRIYDREYGRNNPKAPPKPSNVYGSDFYKYVEIVGYYNPLVPNIAHLYLTDRAKHDHIAAEFTVRFAR
ncbi:Constitutive photomorphogenesis protein 10 [Platanthera zijinensis]|uniref:Constitutive photomorphogenesis protein 10 n=1 Tax=Platanthera zijinensis TaxID=2320716 RepID=A0AAP0GED3_9ASPA